MIEREDAQLVAEDVVPAEDIRTKAASLTGDLLMRGRSRARDLVQPPRRSNLRPPMPPGEQASGVHEGTSVLDDTAGKSMREAGLLLIWVSVFLGTFLIGLSLIE